MGNRPAASGGFATVTPICAWIAPQPQGSQSLQLQNLLSALLFYIHA